MKRKIKRRMEFDMLDKSKLINYDRKYRFEIADSEWPVEESLNVIEEQDLVSTPTKVRRVREIMEGSNDQENIRLNNTTTQNNIHQSFIENQNPKRLMKFNNMYNFPVPKLSRNNSLKTEKFTKEQLRAKASKDLERYQSKMDLLNTHFKSKKREKMLKKVVKTTFSRNTRYIISLRHKKKYWVNDHYKEKDLKKK